jgi:8-oxo-dGTP pyrophosphatase MutT (NUDIX family)
VPDSGGSTLATLPGVAVVLRDAQGRILLHRRREGEGWAPVSGHLQAGESIAAALCREVAEETALTMTDLAFVGIYSDPKFQVVRFRDGRRVQSVTSLFTAIAPAPEQVHGNEEATAWEWFSANALPDELMPYARRWLTDALANHQQPVVA